MSNGEGFGALAAHDHGVHVVVARSVVEHEWRSFRAGQPAVAPGGQT